MKVELALSGRELVKTEFFEKRVLGIKRKCERGKPKQIAMNNKEGPQEAQKQIFATHPIPESPQFAYVYVSGSGNLLPISFFRHVSRF